MKMNETDLDNESQFYAHTIVIGERPPQATAQWDWNSPIDCACIPKTLVLRVAWWKIVRSDEWSRLIPRFYNPQKGYRGDQSRRDRVSASY